ncbi:ATP-binding protein [Neolewinella lacunae]|uniref:ATP-binding protein n=1 Tax=Neolewinella lacunae TaxID=1517758 RepID=A0A923PKM4_9BACT|nr:ATP-binding protein [Neolewinella lacunae]MBC6995837.1 ATP-binding protein [Neolewinella lacunae]MDN3636470.1 ATP-binding protein [Neolewinella lacunae]
MLTLVSDPSNISKVEKYVDQIADRFKLDQEKHASLMLSLTEAVTNAIIHGNKQDRTKTVSIRLAQTRSGLAIRVTDQGCGFDYRQIPDPTSPERICECGGRGVFLMNQLCDKMRYINGGSTVEMQFKLK